MVFKRNGNQHEGLFGRHLESKDKGCAKINEKSLDKKHAPIHHASCKQLFESHFISPAPGGEPQVDGAVIFEHFGTGDPVVAEGFVGVVGI